MDNFELLILTDEKNIDTEDDNVDVEIHLPDGIVYSATFFTLNNLKSLMKRYRDTGECANGLYVWASDMIVVESLTEETIRRVVKDLVFTGEIKTACSRIHNTF